MIKKGCLITILIFNIFVSGCWNKRELNELAIVMGTGVDLTPDGQISVTAQIIRPAGMKSETGGTGTPVNPAMVLNSTGETVADAVHNLISINSRNIFLSHNQIIAIGENFAKKGIVPVLDYFERDPEIRPEMSFIVTVGEAQKILSLPGKLEKTSAVEIHKALRASKESNKTGMVKFLDFLLNYYSDSKSSYAPLVETVNVNNVKTFKLVGMAVFMKDKMIGCLNGLETRGLLWILNKVQGGVVVVKPPSKQGKISIELVRSNCTVKVTMENNNPVFTVKIAAVGNVEEQDSTYDITKPDKMNVLKKELGESISKEVLSTVRKTQKYKTDILGFGEVLHRKYPNHWKLIKKNWVEVFPKVKVEVKTNAQINHSGVKIKATSYKNLAGNRP